MNILEEELYRSFLYFKNEVNLDYDSPGYGLVLDNTKNKVMASIAAVGFALTAEVIGVENGYIPREEGLRRVRRTCKSFLENIHHFQGFFVHYLDINTATPYKKTEYSTIDTAIFLNGAITADQYFADQELHDLFHRIFSRINWRAFFHEYKGRKVLRMAYNPTVGGDYRQKSDDPWIYQWHMLAEQLSLYFQLAASDDVTETEARDLFLGFERNLGTYGKYQYYYSPTNALFIYQFSHAWIDFSNLVGIDGVDWFQNSVTATLANRQWCIDHQKQYPTLGENTWGLTACLTPLGYRNQCIEPNDLKKDEEHVFGVVPPSGVAGSIVFAPEPVKASLEYIHSHYPESFGEYGFTDGFRLNPDNSLWVSPYYVGINKGITMVMLDNYLHGTTWKHYMQHPLIVKATAKLGFQRK